MEHRPQIDPYTWPNCGHQSEPVNLYRAKDNTNMHGRLEGTRRPNVQLF